MGQEKHSQRRRIEAEAADWLARLETGRADLGAFEQWRSANPAHAAAFAQLDAAWSRLDRVRALRPAGPPDPDLLASRDAGFLQSRRGLLRAAMFGGAVVLAGGAALLLNGRAYAETGIGERRAVRLPDGSLLDLNTDSRASWRFDDQRRQVWLERGEAAFEIAPDAEARPFLLAAAGQTAPLDPGVYNARLRGRAAEIVALRQSAETDGSSILLEGHELVISAESQDVRMLSPGAAEAVGAWRRGEIVFNGDTLREAVAEYNRYLTQPISIGDEGIANLRVGGRFTTRDPAEFLQAAEAAFAVEARRQPDGAIVLVRSQN